MTFSPLPTVEIGDPPPLAFFFVPTLDQLSHEYGVSLNVVVEADSLNLQTHIIADGGMYTLLGPLAIATASKYCHLQSSKLVDPEIPRHVAIAMSPHGELTLACRTVMQVTQEIAQSLLRSS